MDRCFFCNSPKFFTSSSSHELSYPFSCKYCGNYRLTRDAKVNCEEDSVFRAKAAAIAQEMYLSGRYDEYKLFYNPDIQSRDNADSIFMENRPFLANYPKDFLEIMDRILLNIGRKTSFSPLKEFRPSIYEFGLFFVNPAPKYYREDRNGSILTEEDYRDIESKISATVSLLKEHNYISVLCEDNSIGGKNIVTPSGKSARRLFH